MRVTVKSEGKWIASFTARTARGLNQQQKSDLKKLRALPNGFGLWSTSMQNRWLGERGLAHLMTPGH